MRIWKIAVVTVLALSSFAAENVAPTKSELEEMYNKAFREFDANNFPEALKELDAIDARQPDLAASQNLRGVILMRQGIYDKAEVALLEAARIDPKFWNARFNLAEIPFLKKDWTEARNRFQQLLSSSKSDLASEAAQLIQYKILLTYLLEEKENMVDSILAKLELSPDTPAVDYVKAAVALQHKNEKEAKDWISVAEKNFSPQLNKLFAESLYEVGWLQKPTGQPRPSLPLMTAAERTEKTKALSRSKFEQAQQALRQRDLVTARKLVDEADQAGPNQPTILNLRGEILMEQKQFDEAEAVFKKAAKLDPKFREAQYNLAQIPFKKKDYAKARERFEALFKQTPGGDKNQAAEIIKFKIYMTLLLEGKDSRAQALMEQFQFTGDTPALYYAQAAWEFKHNNPEKAADWTASAKRIYSEALNSVFADAFYDLGWMQSPAIAAAPAPTIDAATAMATQTETGPAIEPSPIPDSVVAATKQAKESSIGSLALSSPSLRPPIAGTETTASETSQSPTGSSNESVVAATAPAEAAAASSPTPSAVESPVASAAPAEAPVVGETKTSAQTSAAPAVTTKSASAPSAPRPIVAGLASRRTLLVGGLLLGGLFLLAWVVVPEVRRRAFSAGKVRDWQAGSLDGSRTFEANTVPSEKGMALASDLFGGPRQVSLQLIASRPSLRSGLYGLVGSGGGLQRAIEPKEEPSALPPVIAGVAATQAKEPAAAMTEPLVQEQAVPQGPPPRELPVVAEGTIAPAIDPVAEPPFEAVDQSQPIAQVPEPAEKLSEIAAVVEGAVTPVIEPVTEPPFEAVDQSQPIAQVPEPAEKLSEIAAVVEGAVTPVIEPVAEPQFEAIDQGQPIAQVPEPAEKLSEIAAVVEGAVTPVTEPVAEPQFEAIDQGQPIAHQIPISATDLPAVAEVAVVSSYSPNISNAPESSRTTTSLTMPEQSEQFQPAEMPLAADAPPPVSAAHTPVQLTFSFEIISVQLTPTFKIRTLQVRPASKIVTMRLASSQRSQPQLHPQVAFEIAKIQPADSGLGTVRLIQSTRQRQQLAQQPVDIALPSFEVTGLQPISSSDGVAGIQLAPSEQGKAHVQVTADFQMAKVEFSTSFEVTGVVLTPTSRQVSVQLAGADPGAIEEAPVFDVENVRLTDTGDSETLELHAV